MTEAAGEGSSLGAGLPDVLLLNDEAGGGAGNVDDGHRSADQEMPDAAEADEGAGSDLAAQDVNGAAAADDLPMPMAVDGAEHHLSAQPPSAASPSEQAADAVAGDDTSLPVVEHVKAVVEPSTAADDGQASPAAAEAQQAADGAAQPAAAAAAPAPARVPARALYGLPVDEDGPPKAGQRDEQRQRGEEERGRVKGRDPHRPQLPYLPRAEDDGKLPAYAVASAEDGWQGDTAQRSRKGDHADEDPPPGFKPVDLFIGGLPPTADEFDVWQAVIPAAEVVGIKLIRRKRDRGDCRGYGFVRVVNLEAAEAACSTVKEACGAPVSLSLPTAKTLPELHKAAAATNAATPLTLPEDEGSSMRQLLQAVRRQPDPQEAVTTALVAVLHVPSRPRLAFPTGRPQKRPAEAAAGANAAEGAGGEGGVDAEAGTSPRRKAAKGGAERSTGSTSGTAGAAAAEEQLPDASNYLDPYPGAKSLMQQYKARGQGDKTPLAVVNEYASRLALRVEFEEEPAGENGVGPFTVVAKLVNSRGGQSFASSAGRGKTKQLAKQIAGAALLESILETVPAEDLLAPNRDRDRGRPGGGKPYQPQQRFGLVMGEGGRGRGGRGGGGGGRGGGYMPEPGSRGYGRAVGARLAGADRPPQFVAGGRAEQPSWAQGRGGSSSSGGGGSGMQMQQHGSGGGTGYEGQQYGGATATGMSGFGGGMGSGQMVGFAGNTMQQQQQQQMGAQVQQYNMSTAAAALPLAAAANYGTGLALAGGNTGGMLAASQPSAGYGAAMYGTTPATAAAASIPTAAAGAGYAGMPGATSGAGYLAAGGASAPSAASVGYAGHSHSSAPGPAAYTAPSDPRLGRQGAQQQQQQRAAAGASSQQQVPAHAGSGPAAAAGYGQQQAAGYGQHQQQAGAGYGQQQAAGYGSYASTQQTDTQPAQQPLSPYKASPYHSYTASQASAQQQPQQPQAQAAQQQQPHYAAQQQTVRAQTAGDAAAAAAAAQRKYISNTTGQQQAQHAQQAGAAGAGAPSSSTAGAAAGAGTGNAYPPAAAAAAPWASHAAAAYGTAAAPAAVGAYGGAAGTAYDPTNPSAAAPATAYPYAGYPAAAAPAATGAYGQQQPGAPSDAAAAAAAAAYYGSYYYPHNYPTGQ